MGNKNLMIDTILDIGRQCLLQRQEMSMDADISQVDFAVLDMLEPDKKISCKELASCMTLSNSRCSRIVERLQQKGYVRREQSQSDRRAVEVSLTEKGIHLKQTIQELKEACERRILSVMDQEEVKIVDQGIQILRRSLRES